MTPNNSTHIITRKDHYNLEQVALSFFCEKEGANLQWQPTDLLLQKYTPGFKFLLQKSLCNLQMGLTPSRGFSKLP